MDYRKNTNTPYRKFHQNGRNIEDIPHLSSTSNTIDYNDLYLPASFKSNTIAWLDASKNVTFNSTNNKISKWTSKIGNYVFEQTNENMQPNLIKRDINGRNVINFTGVQSLFMNNNSIFTKLDTSYSVAVVFKRVQVTSNNYTCMFCQDSTEAQITPSIESRLYIGIRNNSTLAIGYGRSGYSSSISISTANQYQVVIYINRSSSYYAWVNRVKYRITGSGSKLLTGQPDTGCYCSIGADNNQYLRNFEGNIAELIFFDNEFTDAQAGDLLNYFDTKYNTKNEISALEIGGGTVVEKAFDLDINLVFNCNFNNSIVENVSGFLLNPENYDNYSLSTTSITFNAQDSLSLYEINNLKTISKYMTLFLRIRFPATPTDLTINFNNDNGFSIKFNVDGTVDFGANDVFLHNTAPIITDFYDDSMSHWFVFCYDKDLGVVRVYIDSDEYIQSVTNINGNITFDTVVPTEYFKITCNTPGVLINHLDVLKRPLTTGQITAYRSYVNSKPTSSALIVYNDYSIISVDTTVTNLTSNGFTFTFSNLVFNDTYYNTTLPVDYKIIVTGANFSFINFSNNNATGTASFDLSGYLEPSTTYTIIYTIMYSNVERLAGTTTTTTLAA